MFEKNLGSLKCQATIESMLILAVGMVTLLILTAFLWDSYTTSQAAQQQQLGKDLLNRLAKEIDDAYFLGPGTVKKLILVVPSCADLNMSSFGSRTIILNVCGADLMGSTNVEVRGSWANAMGVHQFVITAFGDFVSVSASKLELSQYQINVVVLQGATKDVNISTGNVSGSPVNYVVSTSFSYSDVNISVTPDGSQTYLADEDKNFAITISCSDDAVGAYSGLIEFGGDENITIPLNIICTST
ncbi:MAG: hypothetical protein NTZ73_02895 [Candidatus Diapherotrites archaeon]|nr:hypothetical protein [Candidatus Diapherotrites archaeon]